MPDGGAVTIAARERNSRLEEGDELGIGRRVCRTLFTDSGTGMDEILWRVLPSPSLPPEKVGEGLA